MQVRGGPEGTAPLSTSRSLDKRHDNSLRHDLLQPAAVATCRSGLTAALLYPFPELVVVTLVFSHVPFHDCGNSVQVCQLLRCGLERTADTVMSRRGGPCRLAVANPYKIGDGAIWP